MLYVSVCLSVGSSLVAASPWLIAGSSLRAASTTIITTWVGKPFRTVDSPGILGHLQLEVPSKLNKLLVLLCNGLNLKRRKC